MTVSETKIVNGATWSSTITQATPTLRQTFNSSTNWTVPNTISAAFFMIAGGGGGGGGTATGFYAGGGGGGGVYPGWLAVQPGSTVGITIGAGGTAGTATDGGAGVAGGASYVSIGNFIAGANGGSGGSSANTAGVAAGGNTFTSNASGISFTTPVISNTNFIFSKDTAATNRTLANENAYAGTGAGSWNINNYVPYCQGGSGLTGGGGGGAGTITFGDIFAVIGYSGCGYGGASGASVVSGASGGAGGISGAGSAGSNNGPGGAGGAGGGGGGAAKARSSSAGGAGGAGAVLIFY